MDTAQWPQGIGVEKLPAIENSNSNANSKPNSSSSEKKPRPLKEQALNCPRCNSTNTKFCYYNNYSLTQPRYFCKTCRRYWTDGGSLRNVPVGGGSRKNKRSSSTAPPPPKKLFPDLGPPDFSPRNPNRIGEGGHDLNLAYDPPRYGGMSEFMAMHQSMGSSNPNSEGGAGQNLPLMELLKRGGGLGSFMSSVPISDAAAAGFSVSPAGFPQEFKSSLGFSVDGIENGFGNLQEPTSNHQSSSSASRILFPFEELKPVSNNDQFENWNGMLAGGSW